MNQQSYYIRLASLPCNVQMLFIPFEFQSEYSENCVYAFFLTVSRWTIDIARQLNLMFNRSILRLRSLLSLILDWSAHNFRGNEFITYRFQTHFHPAGAASFSNWIKSDDTLFNQVNRYSECKAFTAWASNSVWNRLKRNFKQHEKSSLSHGSYLQLNVHDLHRLQFYLCLTLA